LSAFKRVKCVIIIIIIIIGKDALRQAGSRTFRPTRRRKHGFIRFSADDARQQIYAFLFSSFTRERATKHKVPAAPWWPASSVMS